MSSIWCQEMPRGLRPSTPRPPVPPVSSNAWPKMDHVARGKALHNFKSRPVAQMCCRPKHRPLAHAWPSRSVPLGQAPGHVPS